MIKDSFFCKTIHRYLLRHDILCLDVRISRFSHTLSMTVLRTGDFNIRFNTHTHRRRHVHTHLLFSSLLSLSEFTGFPEYFKVHNLEKVREKKWWRKRSTQSLR